MTQGWNVLIVEDDTKAATQLADSLASIQARSRIATNGQEAILFTGTRAPDLVVTEVALPMLNGLEAARFLKTKFSNRTVPVLIVTSEATEATLGESYQIGCEDFFAKPFDMVELLKSARDLLDLGRAENELTELTFRREQSKKGLPPEEDNADELVERICSLRAELATRLIGRGFAALAPTHIERIARLNPDHAALAALRGKAE